MSSDHANKGQGLSNIYVFKSLLQEYAQSDGLPAPVYSTTKEGPSHEPAFRSTVVVNGVKYDSLPGFSSRKVAEQSAAEVALMQLSKSGSKSSAQPVFGTGLCKNLLQEYTQKMNYAIPLYECHENEKRGRESGFYCTVEIGGIKYIGAAATTKKEAEIKAARTALMAIHSAGSGQAEKPSGNSIYTVTPSKSKASQLGINPKSTAQKRKRKNLIKKLQRNKKAGVSGRRNDVQNKEMKGNNVNLVDQDLGIVTADARGRSQDERLNLTCSNGDLETAAYQEQGKEMRNGVDVMNKTE